MFTSTITTHLRPAVRHHRLGRRGLGQGRQDRCPARRSRPSRRPCWTPSALPGVQAARRRRAAERLAVVGPDNKAVSDSSGGPTIGANWYATPQPAVNLTSGSRRGAPATWWSTPTPRPEAPGASASLRIVTGRRRHLPGHGHRHRDLPDHQPRRVAVLLRHGRRADQAAGQGRSLHRGELDAKPGTADDALKAECRQARRRLRREDPAEQEADGRNSVGFIGFMKYVMLGFAGLSLMVGAFLIVNTFQMLVAQRTRELGLLRALGASRRQINLSVRFEALLLGVIGATLGIAAGAGLAYGLIAIMNGVGMNLAASDMAVDAGLGDRRLRGRRAGHAAGGLDPGAARGPHHADGGAARRRHPGRPPCLLDPQRHRPDDHRRRRGGADRRRCSTAPPRPGDCCWAWACWSR